MAYITNFICSEQQKLFCYPANITTFGIEISSSYEHSCILAPNPSRTALNPLISDSKSVFMCVSSHLFNERQTPFSSEEFNNVITDYFFQPDI